MTRFLRLSLGLWLIFAVGQPVKSEAAVTDKQVEAKIAELKTLLYQKQNQQVGGWFGTYHHGPQVKVDPRDPKRANTGAPAKGIGGPTALATLALLIGGESSQDPRVVQALDYLKAIRISGTYSKSLRTQVWSYLPRRYQAELDEDGRRLTKAYHPRTSLFQYYALPEVRDHQRVDHSVSQYGTLGLWQYAKRGGQVPRAFWQHAVRHYLDAQFEDGGWSYNMNKHNERATMTCAGLTVLSIARQQLYRDRDMPRPRLRKAIGQGLAYMDEHFNAGQSGYAGGGYYRYGVERVGLATGVKYLADQDWFRAIAKRIVNKDHRRVIGAAFDLMCLARGRIPVWVNKIQLRHSRWNNRPNDLYFLSRYLSHTREHEVNWQVIPLDKPVRDYLNAPVAWVSTNERVELDQTEQAHLKRYLDLGGLLVANSEHSPEARKSIKRLGRAMYPALGWRTLDSDHPITNLVYEVGQSADGGPAIEVMSNGVRPLIVLPEDDWGMALQREPNLSRVPAGRYMTNLFAFATGRGVLPNRLVRPYPKANQSNTTNESQNTKPGQGQTLWVCQATFGKTNRRGNVEPDALVPLSHILAKQTPVKLKWAEKPLANIGNGTVDGHPIALVHLSAIKGYALTEQEKQAIRAYLQAGGTMLVETVGGRGKFAPTIDKQLRQVFDTDPRRLSEAAPTSALLTGQAIPAGHDLSHIYYRKYALANMNLGQQPRLRAFMIDHRPAILVSAQDLSLGALGVRHWAINGYAIDSARDILSNLILRSAGGKKSQMPNTKDQTNSGTYKKRQ